MSNETKRDVYEEIVNEYGFPSDEGYKQLMDWYDAALPDDLPVIPKSISEYIKNLHKFHRDLVDVFGMVRDLGITRTEPTGVLVWVTHNIDTFARAWVLGVWRVEETGETVKLEAEK
ncbi:hypothetical protein KZR06_08975 [Lacticaseibacillus paracasei]|uniref:hypothetical protein n=1 Tax=Lacticaseibacillus paracasei TaxID=1597 RepID=UPI0021A42F4B|nr:hypothetical protein [Lacticaseibacillus paracasei]UWP75604.1 hypothetical protein KZR06_08975 [Lacticaseibacillus paracasei]